jgi:hypothetical protein
MSGNRISVELWIALNNLRQPNEYYGVTDVIWRLLNQHGISKPQREHFDDTIESLHSGGVYWRGFYFPNGLRGRGRVGRRAPYQYWFTSGGYFRFGGGKYRSPNRLLEAIDRAGGGSGYDCGNAWIRLEFESPIGSKTYRPLDTLRLPWDVQRRAPSFIRR